MVVGHLALAVLFVIIGQWILIPIILLPTYSGWLAHACAITQHLGLQSSVADYRRCCRTARFNPLCRFLYWQMNYHTEHHLYAAVPFHKLRMLHRLVMEDGAPPPNTGLVDAWKEMLMILEKQKESPNLAFDPFSRGGTPQFVPSHAHPLGPSDPA